MGKVILITGASSGMGKETAKSLAMDGHRVYAVARRIDQMNELAELGCKTIKMDITNENDIQQVVDTIIQHEGKIDVLWNNAGYGLFGSVEEVSLEEARKQFEVNLFGLASITQKVVPYMRNARSGTIINTSSMAGKMYGPLSAWYHASKHALEGFSDCLRLELKQFNIKVAIIEPGAISTEFSGGMADSITKFSGTGVYAEMTNKLVTANKKMSSGASKPDVITQTVKKIISTSNPKTRYKVGKLAKPLIWMRTYLGDRIFDEIILSQS